MKTIEIIVSPTGQTTVQTHGFSGSECQQASRFIESALGQTVKETKSAEFYRVAQAQAAQLGSSNLIPE